MATSWALRGNSRGGAAFALRQSSSEPEVAIGAWEYFVRDPDPAAATQKFEEATASGFKGVITNSFWAPGQREPAPEEVTDLRNAADAAEEADVKPLLIVQHVGSRTTPSTPALRAQFAEYAASLARQIPEYRDFIIGNEPNLNRFWLPQFGPNGENVAAQDYLALLAETYDALKAVSGDIRMIGGALAPRGGDDPDAPRHTHSPTQFIRDLGRYYRESGRDEPVMDAFAHHPYLERANLPPTFAHPTVDDDRPRRLRQARRAARPGVRRDGAGGRRPTDPLHRVRRPDANPRGEDRRVYEPDTQAAADVVDEETQERYYRQAYELACSQETVEGLYIFHVWDEPDLLGWQSGLYYADHTPKSSQDAFLDLPSCP